MALYETIMTSVDTTCHTYIQNNVSAVAEGIKDTAFALLGIYVLFWAFAHFLNLIQEPITDSIKRLVKIIFIIGIAFNLATYNSYVVDVLTKGPEELASLFTGVGNQSSFVSSIDKIFIDTWNIGVRFWNDAGVMNGNFGYYFVAIIMFVVAAIISAYSAFLMVLAKIAISVLAALGPLFIISTFFDSTKRFFENWVGMVANYGLVIVLVIAVNKFILDLFMQHLSAASMQSGVDVTTLGPTVATAIISIFVLAQVLSMASGLAGGISLATMGAGRWMASKLTGVGRAGAKLGGAGAKIAGSVATKRARTAIASWRSRGSVTKS